MVKILCPNKQYSGVSASVTFVNGVGETDNPQLIDWFKSHGYNVEGSEPENKPDEETKKEGTEGESTEEVEAPKKRNTRNKTE
jgi:hypothetical protein